MKITTFTQWAKIWKKGSILGRRSLYLLLNFAITAFFLPFLLAHCVLPKKEWWAWISFMKCVVMILLLWQYVLLWLTNASIYSSSQLPTNIVLLLYITITGKKWLPNDPKIRKHTSNLILPSGFFSFFGGGLQKKIIHYDFLLAHMFSMFRNHQVSPLFS